jgi:hypothetical protein
LPDCNDTNDEDLFYFARIKNHYLRLVRSSTNGLQSRQSMQYPVIVDSGANYHMFKEREFFTSLVPTSGKVILGDGKSVLSIQGIGQVKCTVGDKALIIDNVRLVPDLAESIYSLFLHIKQKNHGVHSSFDEGLYLKFPDFTTKAIVGLDDIYLDVQPHTDNLVSVTLASASSQSSSTTPVYCQNTLGQIIAKPPDNLLKPLRQYYSEVKTKWQ